VKIASGSLLHVGASADALPGVTLWEVPAPAGRAELFFPPDNLLASCDEWLPPERRGVASARTLDRDDPICVLPFAAPFGLEVRRLLPDVPSIAARSLWSAGLLIAPALVLLFLIAAQPRSEVTSRRFARALALSWLSVFFAGLGVWRLLWAHRIDMLRDYESVGQRVLQNQTFLVLAGATLACAAALSWHGRKQTLRQLGAGAAAWAVWLVLAGYALRSDLSALEWNGRFLAQFPLSLAIGTSPWWTRRLRAAPDRRWWIAMAALAGFAVAAALAHWVFPRTVAFKLGFAWGAVFAFYAALRACIAGEAARGWHVAATFGAGIAAALATSLLDPGVSAIIVYPGMLVAVMFAGHDARYADDAVRQMSSYQRHHAPLVVSQATLVLLLSVSVAVWAVVGIVSSSDGEVDALLSRSVTFGAIHLFAFMALLFVPAAVLAYRRRGWNAAVPWIVATVLLVNAWVLRGAALDRALASRTQAADRIALVTDPGYALLRSETKFLAGITAWRETIDPASDIDLVDGQGYFGAQLLDPGVLLSVENDYYPVLLLREAGVRGVATVALALLLLVIGLWLISGSRFRHGSFSQRVRALAAVVLGILIIYQPLASLGVLPLTGIAWPGLGLDSPSDFWLLVGLAVWTLLAGRDTADDADARLDELDAELRQSKLFRRVGALVGFAAGALAVAGLLLLGRASAFALRRPNPVDERGRAVAPFDGLESAVEYAYQLQCPWPKTTATDAEALVPEQLLADPIDEGPVRFHEALTRTWLDQRSSAVDVALEFVTGDAAVCTGARGAWSFEHTPDAPAECRMTFKAGWPEVHLAVTRAGKDEHRARCSVQARTDVLRQLRIPVRRPYRDARIRLVSRAMGVPSRDVGELVSGHLAVRLRPGAGAVDVSSARDGLYAAERVQISDELAIEIGDAGAVLRYARGAKRPADQPEPLLFVREAAPTPVQLLEPDERSWRLVPASGGDVSLESMAVVVVGGPHARSLWLFRPAADPLLADDIATVRGERRRHYLYGGMVPELGWVNPFSERMSLGLDGWVRVALTEYDESPSQQPPTTWVDGPDEREYCGTLEPLDEPLDARVARVCATSPFDGVLECRVSLQPELSIRLRHLTELISLAPDKFARDRKKRDAVLPMRADFVLLRGDTGEIAAQGQFVPGRASSAYAPATPELEQHLIRLREDRDPSTGRKLPRDARGEASAEKADWVQPIAVGSTMKPMLARALELADPLFARALIVNGSKIAGARCRKNRHALLGHCPPTDSLWNHEGVTGLSQFLAQSVNWYQATVGLVGTAVPRGAIGFGEDETSVDFESVRAVNVGAHKSEAALWTRNRGKTVISARHQVHLAALRETAMWKRFEQILGRPLCTLGNKRSCRRDATRKDLCAARALPIEEPTRDLRHLVALGPDSFNMYPALRDPKKRVGRISTGEYLQFLRGSGIHPLGSLAQLTDAFNRVVYEPAPTGADGRYRLAASWFPVAAVGSVPAWDCANIPNDDTVAAGICEVARTGPAAKTLRPLLADETIAVYGVKTGTIDSLADIAEKPEACEAFRGSHTVPDRDATDGAQPYWLDCKRRASGDVNDSLLIISFGIRTDAGVVPLTLGLRFQRSGLGLATASARYYIDAIRDYFVATE
jgi:hypothetical protein